MAIISYFLFKIALSAMVVNTDTLLEINDCLHTMADRNNQANNTGEN